MVIDSPVMFILQSCGVMVVRCAATVIVIGGLNIAVVDASINVSILNSFFFFFFFVIVVVNKEPPVSGKEKGVRCLQR